MSKKIFCTVTNDLSYDQRMARICGSLAKAGYRVVLVGRRQRGALPLENRPFAQKRLSLLFEKGKLFYLEYNIRLFFYLLFRRMDAVCAIDLDTILPCYFITAIKRIPRIYDAHELFCEMQEVVSRPAIYRIWKAVEKYCVPAFRHGYTVNGLIADEFEKMYGVRYEVIRNLPWRDEEMFRKEGHSGAGVGGEAGKTGHPGMEEGEDAPGEIENEGLRENIGRAGETGDSGSGAKTSEAGTLGTKAPAKRALEEQILEEKALETRKTDGEAGSEEPLNKERFILYQGAVNEGRCFETLIPAMRQVDARLVICGNGNFMERAVELVKQNGLEGKIVFRGLVRPEELKKLTGTAWCGITLFERKGMSNYYSLANRFFDYMHAGIPQLAMNYPAYREINNLYPIAVLIDEPGIGEITAGLTELLNNRFLYNTLQGNCPEASRYFSWQEEEKKLIRYYQKILD